MIRSAIILFLCFFIQITADGQGGKGYGYDYFGEFVNGRATVYSDGLWGVIDENGNEIIPPKYHKIYPFQNGRAYVQVNSLWGIIAEDGREIIAPIYTKIYDFENGRAQALAQGRI